uniref:Uncharacterized protein n=1 Tax=Solibacter usitatus (strain Ellin6076) TaxID=234267 RepID=Q01PU7_SOLUE
MTSNFKYCAALIAVLAAACGGASAQCGVERWSVKTGTDPDNAKVALSTSTATTIASLVALPTPSVLPPNNRLQPTESTVFVIDATLIEFKLETDSDYHLVIRDSAGKTMITEIPSPSCVGAGSPFAIAIASARSKFDAQLQATSLPQTTSIPVQIKGVGFFDSLHGQTGVAPNGIELHPVLDIIFNPANPSPNFTLAAPATLAVMAGTSTAATVNTTVSGGLNAAVSLAAGGLPGGAESSFWPASIVGPGSSTLTIQTSATTPTGTYTVTVTGTSGAVSHSANIVLTVTAAGTAAPRQLIGNPGFENGSGNPAPWTASSGVVSNLSGEPPRSGVWNAWLDGYGVAHTDTLSHTVTLPATLTSATLSFWLHIDTSETSTTAARDTLKVQVANSAGTVLATLAAYSNLNRNAGYTQRTFDLSSYKGQTIKILLTGVENSSLQTSFVLDDFALTVQ